MKSDLRARFGRLVAAQRRRKRMTQQQLADASGLSIDMINKIEGGSTGARFPSIERIAKALAIDPAELFLPEGYEGSKVRSSLADIVSRLSGLSDRDLTWVDGILTAALKSRG